MEKIDVTEKILDFEGKPAKDGETEVTWRNVIFLACNSTLPNEQLTSEQKVKSFQVTQKAYSKKEVDFTPTEVTYLLERIEKILPPLIVGRALEKFGELKPLDSNEPETKEVIK